MGRRMRRWREKENGHRARSWFGPFGRWNGNNGRGRKSGKGRESEEAVGFLKGCESIGGKGK
jgi:hypothetical protein